MLRRLVSLCVVFVFISCASTSVDKNKTEQGGQDIKINPVSEETVPVEAGTIVFKNHTPFTVNLVRGSGRVDAASIQPYSSATIPNSFDRAESYFPLFDIPLTASFSLQGLRPEDINQYYQIDNNQKYQEIEIRLPQNVSDSSSYIVFENNSKGGGISLSRNESNNLMTGLNFEGGKYNINEGETMVFRENPRDLQRLRINPANISFGEMTYKPSHVYYFSFDGSDVRFTDSRPLVNIGESSWKKQIDGDSLSPFAENDDRSINVLSLIDNAHIFSVLDSGGNEIERKRIEDRTGDAKNYSIVSMLHVTPSVNEDNFLLAGYEQDGNLNLPLLEKRSNDGVLIWKAPASRRSDSEYAAILSIVHGEGNSFLAGGAAESYNNAMFGFYKPYLQAFRDEGDSVEIVWEMGPNDFPSDWGMIRFVTCDTKNNRYIIAGDVSSLFSTEKKSFVAFISKSGELIHSIIINDVTFNQVLCGTDGSIYLAGEEIIQNQAYAVIRKYDAGGNPLPFATRRLNAHSYYQSALIDEETGLLVLGGTFGAETSSGKNGRPFIQAIDTASGEEKWFEELSSVSRDVHLTANVQKAADYGFIVSLAGVNEYYSPPFIIVRLNSQGRYIN
jgi:hypothetical protein